MDRQQNKLRNNSISENTTIYLMSISCICRSGDWSQRDQREPGRRSRRSVGRWRPVAWRSRRSAGRRQGSSASARAAYGSAAQCASRGDRRRRPVRGRRQQNTLPNQGMQCLPVAREQTGDLEDFLGQKMEERDLMGPAPAHALSSRSSLTKSLEARLLGHIK
jgi:hypothetical protein